MGLTYRREIDGLRAVAVAAVVLYHAGLGGAGFVGVDVFFVISGYLITALLIREKSHSGRIDLAGFYARRARRILPAVVTVTLTTLGLAWLVLPHSAFPAVAKSAAASMVFAANLYFPGVTGGYFDGASNELPLLHLWSLSVEEQFYLFWPALLMVLLRKRSPLVPVMATLAAASFALAVWLMARDTEAAFFLMPARFWELAVGGLIAAMPARPLPRYLIPTGIGLIVLSCVVTLGDFPGIGALPPVLGACLVVAGVHGGGTNRLLASRPFVGLGLISYSLYLWHWPLLALYRAITIGAGEQVVRLELCAVAVVLAALTYRLIEQPFRRRGFLRGPSIAIGAALVLCIFGTAFVPVPPPAPGNEALAAQAAADTPPRRECEYNFDTTRFPLCAEPAPTGAVWGDSLASSWEPLGKALTPRSTMFTYPACPPFMGYLSPAIRKDPEHCIAHNRQVAAYVRGLDTVVLVANWQGYLREGDEMAKMREGLTQTLGLLRGVRRVLIVGPTPHMRAAVPRCIRAGEECGVSRLVFEASARPTRAMLADVSARFPNVQLVDPASFLCRDALCPGVMDGLPLYYDDLHPTQRAARKFATAYARGIDWRARLQPVAVSRAEFVSAGGQ